MNRRERHSISAQTTGGWVSTGQSVGQSPYHHTVLRRVVRCKGEMNRKGEIAVVVEPVELWSELKWIHGWRAHHVGASHNDIALFELEWNRRSEWIFKGRVINPARPIDGRSMCSMIGSLNVNTGLEMLKTTSALSHWSITRRWSWAKDRKWPKTLFLTCSVRCIKQSQFNTAQTFDNDHSMPIVLISLSVGGREETTLTPQSSLRKSFVFLLWRTGRWDLMQKADHEPLGFDLRRAHSFWLHVHRSHSTLRCPVIVFIAEYIADRFFAKTWRIDDDDDDDVDADDALISRVSKSEGEVKSDRLLQWRETRTNSPRRSLIKFDLKYICVPAVENVDWSLSFPIWLSTGGHWAFSQTLEPVRMQFHQDDQLEEEKSFDADVIHRKKKLNDGALSITRLSCSTGRIDALDEQRSLSVC